VLLAASLVLAAGCARRTSAKLSAPKPVRVGWTQTGVASWYGVPYDGRRASSGEVFDMRKLTAAHRSLPFDTWLEVSNLENGKSVEVRINDRGPFVGGRIIDLSLAAAGEIDMVRSGTARVRLKVIRAPHPQYIVQMGVFSDRVRADAFCKTLSFPDARVIQDQTRWRVVVGSEMTRDAAEALAAQIRKSGNEALVVK
jgi:rare lipoprotein A